MALRRSMGWPGLRPLLLAGLASLLLPGSAAAGLKLMGAPVKMTVSQGQPVKLNCSVEGMEDPDIHWMKDGTVVQNASQVSISISEHSWIGLLSPSPYGDWVPFQTKGLAPARAPQNFHAIRTDSGLILEWEEVIPEDPGEGPLGPYKLSWVQENGTQDELMVEGTRANLTDWDPQKDLILRVCASNAIGDGPWSQPLVVSSHDHAGRQGPPHSRTSWVPVVLGVLTALITAAALALILLRKRRKETRFGQAFDSVMARGEPAVHFRAARSFNRERPERIEATLDSLGISDELKEKLEDVLIPEQQFTLGRMLGKGMELAVGL